MVPILRILSDFPKYRFCTIVYPQKWKHIWRVKANVLTSRRFLLENYNMGNLIIWLITLLAVSWQWNTDCQYSILETLELTYLSFCHIVDKTVFSVKRKIKGYLRKKVCLMLQGHLITLRRTDLRYRNNQKCSYFMFVYRLVDSTCKFITFFGDAQKFSDRTTIRRIVPLLHLDLFCLFSLVERVFWNSSL